MEATVAEGIYGDVTWTVHVDKAFVKGAHNFLCVFVVFFIGVSLLLLLGGGCLGFQEVGL